MALPSVSILCTDSCKQVTCNCCSSNVSVKNREKRIVRYCESDNELQDAPAPNSIAKLFNALGCCGSKQIRRKENAQACQAVNNYLIINYQVGINEAAKDSCISIDPIQRGDKALRVGDFESLKSSAVAICKKRSWPPSKSNTEAPTENFSVCCQKYIEPQKISLLKKVTEL